MLSEKKSSFLVALVWPMAGLIESMVNYGKPYAKNLFWLFCAFYGLVHIYYPIGTVMGSGADSVRYAMTLEQIHDTGMNLSEFFSNLYSGGQSVDPYILIITYFVSIFTGNPHFLFFAFAIIFGFFLSRNIWYVVDNIGERLNFTLAIFVVSFALITPIWAINGVRMWTAMHIFVYGLLPYLLNGDSSKLWWCYVCFLVHFSFLLPIALLSAFILIPKKANIFFIIYLLSWTVQELNLEMINSRLTGLLGGVFDAKISVYANEDYLQSIQESQQQLSAHVIIARDLAKYVYLAAIVMIYFQLKKIENPGRLVYIYCAICIFYSFANILSLMPSGGRFISLAQMLTLFLMTQVYVVSNENYHFGYKFMAYILIFPIIFAVRAGMDFWGISLLFGNWITCWWVNNDIPLIDYIK